MTPTTKRYKKEAEQAQSELDCLKRKIEQEKKDRAKNWSAIVYCDNCMEVNSVSIPQLDIPVKDVNCVVCGIRGRSRLVRKVNCERTQ